MSKSLTYRLVFIVIVLASAMNSFGQERGFNLGFVYPLSIQGVQSKQNANVFSLHALAGLSRAEHGFTAAGFGNMVLEDADGFQVAGFYNFIGGHAHGFKAAGFINTYGDARGFQSAGFMNLSRGNIVGMQGAGFMNLANDVRGFQGAGFINVADSIDRGVQGAGFINIAGNVEGAQIAGYINIAKKVKGVQISGFLNVADSSEYPIGLVNIVQNGEKFLGVTTDDNLSTILALRSGSKKLYGVLGVGYNFRNNNEVIALQYGFGAHFFSRPNFRLNVESTVTNLYGRGRGDVTKVSVSVLPAVKIGHAIELFAGPSVNYANSTSSEDNDLSNHYLWRHTSNHSEYKVYGMYVGYTAGVHVGF